MKRWCNDAVVVNVFFIFVLHFILFVLAEVVARIHQGGHTIRNTSGRNTRTAMSRDVVGWERVGTQFPHFFHVLIKS